MAKKSTDNTNSTADKQRDSDRNMARQAYNEALPYTHPDADYRRAHEYRRQIADGQARSGR